MPVNIAKPILDAPIVNITNVCLSTPPNYKLGESVATRLAYGTALAKIAENNSRVIALDADTKNSTYSDKIKVVWFLLTILYLNMYVTNTFLLNFFFRNIQKDMLSASLLNKTWLALPLELHAEIEQLHSYLHLLLSSQELLIKYLILFWINIFFKKQLKL